MSPSLCQLIRMAVSTTIKRLAPGTVGVAARRAVWPSLARCRIEGRHPHCGAPPGVGERAGDGLRPEDRRLGRTLPLSPALSAALRHAQATQKAERLALGPDYGQGENVVCDEAGRAYHPDTMSNYWRALCAWRRRCHRFGCMTLAIRAGR